VRSTFNETAAPAATCSRSHLQAGISRCRRVLVPLINGEDLSDPVRLYLLSTPGRLR
jgi:hypothetical protein